MPQAISNRHGCAVILRWTDDECCRGGTEGRTCWCTLRGAQYATLEITVRHDRIVSWDPGL